MFCRCSSSREENTPACCPGHPDSSILLCHRTSGRATKHCGSLRILFGWLSLSDPGAKPVHSFSRPTRTTTGNSKSSYSALPTRPTALWFWLMTSKRIADTTRIADIYPHRWHLCPGDRGYRHTWIRTRRSRTAWPRLPSAAVRSIKRSVCILCLF